MHQQAIDAARVNLTSPPPFGWDPVRWRTAWTLEIKHLEYELVQLNSQVANAEARDAKAVELGRPPGCWCLGLGGKGYLVIQDDGTLRWTEMCVCPEAQRAQAKMQEQLAQEQADEAQRAAEVRAEVMLERWARSGVPLELADCRLSTYPAGRRDLIHELTAFQDLERFSLEHTELSGWRRRGRGFYLHGPRGRGKSGLCVSALYEWMQLGASGFFTNPIRYLDQLQAGFTNQPELREHAQRLRERVYLTNLLVLDDFGTEKPSAWVQKELFALLDYRMGERLPTLITSNFSPEIAARRLCPDEPEEVSGRLADRLHHMCDVRQVAGGVTLRIHP